MSESKRREEREKNDPGGLYTPRVLLAALTESLKLQAHYAELLNMHDGGERKWFSEPAAWIHRLVETKTIAAEELTRNPAEHFFVNNIVAARDKMPYLQLSTEMGLVVQLTIAQARQVAADIVQSAARGEADAMLLKFFSATGMPLEAGGAMMMQFRDFRAQLDREDADRV